jgi:hypothetical protein
MNSPAVKTDVSLGFRKDRSLDQLADKGNVAQFVSFAPRDGALSQTHSRVTGFPPNHIFGSAFAALEQLLALSADRTINLRSFSPDSPRSREFVYGVASAKEALKIAYRLSSEGLFVIANETVDVADGGVSGVAQGDIVEFAPDDTPRCVEKPGVASLPRNWAISILAKVYRFSPDIPDTRGARLEFSVHPRPRGWRGTNTLTWEYELTDYAAGAPAILWPNRFSRHIGDKVFGLLIADEIGVSVPLTTVISRRVSPFSFGRPTGVPEVWIRTSPREPEPGKYTTLKGWVDPYKLMAGEDPEGTAIASILCQAAVPAQYSGAAIVLHNGELAVEGRRGEGNELMVGTLPAEPLPVRILTDVRDTYELIAATLGPVRFEWVHDGLIVWVVQLHRGITESTPSVLVPGEAKKWVDFHVSEGLSALRSVLTNLPPDDGLSLIGDVGLTSHLADLIRKSGRPARIVAPAQSQ